MPRSTSFAPDPSFDEVLAAPGLLIGDFGHPNWPGWKLLIGLLCAAAIAQALSNTPITRAARTPRPAADIVRLARLGRTGPSRHLAPRPAPYTGHRALNPRAGTAPVPAGRHAA